MFKTITVSKLGKYHGEYHFTFSEKEEITLITIPGFGGGLDGPTEPTHPEQLEWMRQQSGLNEVWYLTWNSKSKNRIRKFIDKLEKL